MMTAMFAAGRPHTFCLSFRRFSVREEGREPELELGDSEASRRSRRSSGSGFSFLSGGWSSSF